MGYDVSEREALPAGVTTCWESRVVKADDCRLRFGFSFTLGLKAQAFQRFRRLSNFPALELG